MTENKQRICSLLLKALQETSFLHDLNTLEYTPKDADPDYPQYNGLETVTAVFDNGCKKKINVEMDSGVAMIRDIMKELK